MEASRGGAAVRIVRGDESRGRRGGDVDIPWRRDFPPRSAAAAARSAEADLAAYAVRRDRRRKTYEATPMVRACALWLPPTAAAAAVAEESDSSSDSSETDGAGSFSATASRRSARATAKRRAMAARRKRGIGCGGDVGGGLAADGLVVAAARRRDARLAVRVDWSDGVVTSAASGTDDGSPRRRPRATDLNGLGRYLLRRIAAALPPHDAARAAATCGSFRAAGTAAWGERAHGRLLRRTFGVPRDEVLPFYVSRRDCTTELLAQRIYVWGAVYGETRRAPLALDAFRGAGVRQLAATQRALLPEVGGGDACAALCWSGRVPAAERKSCSLVPALLRRPTLQRRSKTDFVSASWRRARR